jgi:hypothetical protein
LCYSGGIDIFGGSILQKLNHAGAFTKGNTSLRIALPQTVTRLAKAKIKKVGLDGKQRTLQVVFTGGAGRGAGVSHFIT